MTATSPGIIRRAGLYLATVVTVLTGVLCLGLAIYAVVGMAAMLIRSGGEFVAPDTGFLLAILGHFGIAAGLLLVTAARTPRTKGWGTSLLAMGIVYAFLTIIYGGPGLRGEPFYGIIPTTAIMVLLMRLVVLGMVSGSVMSLLRARESG